ncbi:TonB-dependent receptor [Anseongella ginsenosidimutans]|uniref:TonB-dependent receptor n=1 Tax=Anseongella ginsenosidimutans TaxID=496056 RepID=A0A4V2UTN4_9SPHI|nr:TonB-dependent receptor [Anseongella ginsenosidimutans]QEC52319.1 hypothetical protein FRZ59_08205 [Anseongella ginsenosidimutans]TCS86882.1 TonB-dependent receptor [Anseongella ginsenosidimutans]
MNKWILFLLAFAGFTTTAYAQQGTLTGVVVDGASGETLIGVNITIPEANAGLATDLDGKYNIQLAPGTYTLEASFIAYQTKVIKEIVIKTGEVTRVDIPLTQESLELQQVIVTASSVDNSEVSMLRLQKNSLSIQDGISAQEINKIGFSNSAESMKRITGAAIEDGKFIVMRGLADRYSIATMNGVVLPSTTPYRNSTSMDLIPSTMLDNIVVKKTFTPDLPGNFTGGAVDISTKSLPDAFYLNIGLSASFNDQTTFNDNFLRDPVEGKYDWLGYDDGSRKIPDILLNNEMLTSLGGAINDIRSNPEDQQLINRFNSTMQALAGRGFSVNRHSPGLNKGINFSVGNRLRLKDGRSLGYNLGINYKQDHAQYDNRVVNNYTARMDFDNRMVPYLLSNGTESVTGSNLGGIFSLGYQLNNNNRVKASILYNNSADQSVLNFDDGSMPQLLSGSDLRNRAISFTRRSLLNAQLQGDHVAGFLGGTKVEWSGNYIVSRQYEPDKRLIAAPVFPGGTYNFVAEMSLPFHFFRDLRDEQYSGKIDLSSGLEKIDLKYGAFFSRKERDFEERRYQLSTSRTPDASQYVSFSEANGDYERFFAAGNTGVLGVRDGEVEFGNAYQYQTPPSSFYEGHEQVAAAYLMSTFDITDKLKTVLGARVEFTDIAVGIKSGAGEKGTINTVDVLPSLNFIYALNDRSNLRLSGTRTLARPNMRELAPFSSFELSGAFAEVGNPGLKRTNITNLDFRYELFPRPSELFALSLFYKNFENPIIKELSATSSSPVYQYVNTGTAKLMGVEVELRQKLDFISLALEKFNIGANFSYIYSRVDMRPEEYEIRKNVDPDIKDWRPFAAQSPYIANLILSYDNPEKGWQSTVFANMFGPRLFANGRGAAPDTYEMYGRINDKANNRITSNFPLPELNYRLRKSFANSFSVALTINNILDYSVVRYQEHNGIYYTNDVFNPGRTFQLSLGYEIR